MTSHKIYLFAIIILLMSVNALASSHREAPLIANDPLADNTDLYAFRSPDDPNTVTIIANYIPGQLPHGGPNYYTFGENVRYEIHIDNDVTTTGDDIIYRATFTQVNNDPTTFFNIRLGAENLQNTYTLERSTDGGASYEVILENGIVPPNNIGPRSIQTGVGLGASSYESLIQQAITTTATGETVYCGPAEDPFFVDLGGVFDLGDLPRQEAMSRDGLECYNVHSIALKIPISTLQKDGLSVDQADGILDGNFVIGVWASASRPAMRTLNAEMGTESYSGDWVQVSRLGMPLTNEAVIPIGAKDEWNALTPYNENPAHYEYFFNPELGLYMDDDQFGGAVPAFSPLRIQTASLAGLLGDGHPGFDFSNGADGLYPLKGNAVLDGTALDDDVFGTLLLPDAAKPRSVDLWPAFHTGVPNAIPYQLATGKMGNPLNAGKPFVNNFLPNGGDMLRLNMAVPPTPRDSDAFSALGLVQAAVLGLTDPMYAASTDIQFIPNMDGFPNGRRLEDDVTRIELQAVSGVVLAAVGLWYDDFDATDPNASPLTTDLLDVLTYSTGVDANDRPFKNGFPYVGSPYSGTGACSGNIAVDRANEVECQLDAFVDNVICNSDGASVFVNLMFMGGTPPYTISDGTNEITLSDNSLMSLFGPFPAETGYNIVVSDAEGCTVTLEEGEIPCVTLAVELIEFNGEVQEEGNLLNWATATEYNSDRFLLQRSANGLNFTTIAAIEAAGTSEVRTEYEYLDTSSPSGLSYYRLIEVNQENKQSVQGVITLNRSSNAVFGIQEIYPVPANDNLSIDFNTDSNSNVEITILDLYGRVLKVLRSAPVAGTNSVNLDVSNLADGFYCLSLTQNDVMVSTRLMIGK